MPIFAKNTEVGACCKIYNTTKTAILWRVGVISGRVGVISGRVGLINKKEALPCLFSFIL